MSEVLLRLDKKLIYFTEKKYSSSDLRVSFNGKRSIKDLIESIGVPHVEIGSVILDGQTADVNAILDGDCLLEVYSPVPGLFPDEREASSPRFILDVHLGKLAVNLRMLGFDADYSNDRSDAELAGRSEAENKILLSCDRGLMMRRKVHAGMIIRSRDPIEQTAEVLRRFDLSRKIIPFSRCLNCSGLLENAGCQIDLTENEKNNLPPKVLCWCDDFTRCTGCGQIYWKGAHFKKMQDKINIILQKSIAI